MSDDEIMIDEERENKENPIVLPPVGAILYEVYFKACSHIFCHESSGIAIQSLVIVQADRGYDIGVVSREISPDEDILTITSGKIVRKILSIITNEDKYIKYMLRSKVISEFQALTMSQSICSELKVGPSVDIYTVEFQADRKKLTVYYKKNADVSLCKLIRKLHSAFKMRIWMENIDNFMKDCQNISETFRMCAEKYFELADIDLEAESDATESNTVVESSAEVDAASSFLPNNPQLNKPTDRFIPNQTGSLSFLTRPSPASTFSHPRDVDEENGSASHQRGNYQPEISPNSTNRSDYFGFYDPQTSQQARYLSQPPRRPVLSSRQLPEGYSDYLPQAPPPPALYSPPNQYRRAINPTPQRNGPYPPNIQRYQPHTQRSVSHNVPSECYYPSNHSPGCEGYTNHPIYDDDSRSQTKYRSNSHDMDKYRYLNNSSNSHLLDSQYSSYTNYNSSGSNRIQTDPAHSLDNSSFHFVPTQHSQYRPSHGNKAVPNIRTSESYGQNHGNYTHPVSSNYHQSPTVSQNQLQTNQQFGYQDHQLQSLQSFSSDRTTVSNVSSRVSSRASPQFLSTPSTPQSHSSGHSFAEYPSYDWNPSVPAGGGIHSNSGSQLSYTTLSHNSTQDSLDYDPRTGRMVSPSSLSGQLQSQKHHFSRMNLAHNRPNSVFDEVSGLSSLIAPTLKLDHVNLPDDENLTLYTHDQDPIPYNPQSYTSVMASSCSHAPYSSHFPSSTSIPHSTRSLSGDGSKLPYYSSQGMNGGGIADILEGSHGNGMSDHLSTRVKSFGVYLEEPSHLGRFDQK